MNPTEHSAENLGRYPVSVIVPCYNEALRLDVVAFRCFLAEPSAARLIFVDDGSRDATIAVLGKVCAGFEQRSSILQLEKNSGKAEAVRQGLNHALEHFAPAIVGFWDADLATPLPSIQSFVLILDTRSDLDMIFGARVKLLGRHIDRAPARHYLGRIFATVVSTMLRLPIYDTQCGAKLFRVNPAFRRAMADPFLSKWVFDVEILARLVQMDGGSPQRIERSIYEYPLETWEEVAGSKVRPHHFVTALLDVLRIKRKYLS
jgi:glycosyltransferase involved in cell wall biosynthesis